MLSLVFGLQLSFLSFYYFWDIYDKQLTLTSYQEVLEQRVEAESNFLNAQVNPHFLFNTLNNIYSLTFNDTKEAKLSIEKMLSLISYIHDESGSNWIDLNTEIEFLKSYLNLELLRNKENNVRLIFEVDGDLNGKRIAPLILINFIENAFKHGVKSNLQKSYINIRIDVYEQNIVFVIRNKKGEKHHDLDKQIGGIGLKNVKRRLELIYPRNYDLKIKDKKGYYEVKLVLGNNKW
ncbi:MAG: histidine kinase [Taibaiella sp.]|nr:histidine kinase [Taibaiella sp.]